MSASLMRASMRAAVRGLWTGELDIYGFIDSMMLSIERYYAVAWDEGLEACGITHDEMTMEERIRLRQEINTEIGYTAGYGDAIIAGSRAMGGRLSDMYLRLEMWVNRYAAVRSIAQSYACADQKLKWVMHPMKEHCSDCLMLDGRVYRASVWRKYNLEPRMRSLKCGGFKCGCDFILTDEPGSSGHPPVIR